MLALCYTLAHSDRVTGLLYLSGPGLDATATTRDRVRAARLARLTEAERARLLAAEQRLSDNGDDEDAAATVARLLWLTDFADRSSAPDFTAEPLFAYPRNEEAAAALNQDRVRWLADPTLRRRLRKLATPPWSSTADAIPSPPRAPPSLPGCSPPHAGRSCRGWATRRGSKTPRWSVRRYGASSTPCQWDEGSSR
jgi:proline iminopeptidase